MNLLPDMVPKVLWRLEEANNQRTRLPNLDWVVFLHDIWMEMFVKSPSMAPPPVTVGDQTKVEI